MTDSIERWLPIASWEALYEVSDLGRVRSLDRQTPAGRRKGRVLKQTPQANGYLTVGLSRDGCKSNRLVHELVLEAFTEPRPAGMVGRHGPGGLRDNRLVNLCWGTQGQNIMDKWRDGTMPHGSGHPQARLTEAIVAECRRRWRRGESSVSLAQEFEVGRSTMWSVVHGQTWRHVG